MPVSGIALPPLSIGADVAARPSCEVVLDLRDTVDVSRPVLSLPEYDAGLRALANDKPLDALEHLRGVVEQDEELEHGSAAVLACLLSLQLGDMESFRALRDVCLGNKRLDKFAAPFVSTSRLSIPASVGEDAPTIVLTECLQMPVIAVQLALVGSLIQEKRPSEAAELLESITAHVPESQLVTSPAQQVSFRDLSTSARAPMCFAVGIDADGEPLVCDLIKVSHLLVAGSNGTEKTSFLQSMICSLLMETTPDQLLFLLVDHQDGKLTEYNGIPNVICPVAVDPYEALMNVTALVAVMDERYELAQECGATSLQELNKNLADELPYILVVIDEMADLVAIDKKASHKAITSIAQRGHAAGIRLVLATQFPRGDVCTNSIKHAVPSRIAFLTRSPAESRIIIDATGAQDLFGNGDCLYAEENRGPVWVQSGHVTSAEAGAIIDHWRGQVEVGDRATVDMWQLPFPGTMVREARISGIPDALCALYSQGGRPDEVLTVTTRYPAARLDMWKAGALAQKGLIDAALLVCDEWIRRLRSPVLIADAQYVKAKLLVDMGNMVAARRELAQVYVAAPEFIDAAGLLAKLDAKRQTKTRSPIPEAVRHGVWRRDDGRCVECGSQESLEFDHVIPVSRGGSNTERNLQLLCERCNREKSAKI
jgi:FtsK/SpoIIIE family/HNH endonuclease